MCADVVVVGGGPVGCWTAIQIKNRNPDLQVHIYERDENYRRDNKLSIDRASFESHRKVMGDALEAQLFKDIAAANNSAAYLQGSVGLRRVTHISTQDLEKILKDHCEKRGITFAIKAIETPNQVMELHPECSIFVGADGAHSKMRKGLLGENDVYQKDLLHSFDVTYRVKGQAKYLAEPTYDKMDMIVVETVGKEQDGETTVGLRFLVDQEQFEKFPEATFKKPVVFGSRIDKAERIFKNAANPKIVQARDTVYSNEKKAPDYMTPEYWEGASHVPDFVKAAPKTVSRVVSPKPRPPEMPEVAMTEDALQRQCQRRMAMEKTVSNTRGSDNQAVYAVSHFEGDLQKFQDIRKEFTGENAITGSETVTKIKLSQYASKKFAVTVDNQSRRAGWFLVGDAAMGVPFYRSVNIGLKMGSQLGAVIGGNDFSTGVKAKLYNALRPMKLASEFGLVATKLSGINVYKNAIRPTCRVLGSVGLGVVLLPFLLAVGLCMVVNPRARVM